MLHLDYNTYKLEKIFIELRFKDSFKLPISDTKYKILDKLSKKYPLYNTQNPEAISLSNPEQRINVHIHLNRIIVDWDEPKSFEEFIKISLADCSFLLKCLDVTELQRLGLRTMHSYKGINQQSITEFMFKEFISPKLKTPDFADTFKNPSIQFSGAKGSLEFNFALGYQQVQVIHGDLGTNKVNSQIRDLLMVDLDCYRESVKVSKLQSLMNEIKEMNLKLPNYLQKIKG